MLINQISWENEFLWNIFSGITLPIIILFLATAIAIIFYIKNKIQLFYAFYKKVNEHIKERKQ